MTNRYFPVFVFFVLTRLIAIFFALPGISDIGIYFIHSLELKSGLIPYAQFPLEYPPLSLVPIYFTQIIFPTENIIEYAATFATLLFVTDYLCLETCRYYCKNRLKMDEEGIAYMSFLYALFGLLMFKLLYHRLDLIVALSFSLSLILFHAASPRLKSSFGLNAFLGFFYKIIPAMTMPIAIIFKARDISEIIKNSAIFFLSLVCGIWLIEIYTNHQFITNMLFHERRGIQIESIFGSFFMFKNMLIEEKFLITTSFGSSNINASHQVEMIAKFLGHFALLCFYISLFFFFRKKKISEENFLDATLITILLFLSLQRVLSPQFFIWLIPIGAIWLAKNRSAGFLFVFLFLFFSTWAIFSIDYYALTNQEPILITTLFLRNLTLIILTIFLIKKFLKHE